MAKTVFDVLKEKIEEEITSAEEFLSGGGAKDFPQYKETTGLIRGLQISLRTIEDLSRNNMEDDND